MCCVCEYTAAALHGRDGISPLSCFRGASSQVLLSGFALHAQKRCDGVSLLIDGLLDACDCDYRQRQW